MRILLASTSPRRRQLLEGAGFDLEIVAPDIDETPRPNEGANELVVRLSREKCAAVKNPSDLCVIAADTVVVLANEILGKPNDADDARQMLKKLSGAEHQVLTGFHVSFKGRYQGGVVKTCVWFRDLSDAEIDRYVRSGEPLDRAGSYAIQGGGGAFVDRIEGSYPNVVGLPVAEVLAVWRGLVYGS